jgi:amino-acid N-acetyltransferase
LIKSLKESPGKRDARNFLKHFDSPQQTKPATPSNAQQAASEVVERAHHNEWRLTRTGVNLGNLYEPTKAIQNNPVFAREPLPEKRISDSIEPLHLALVKLRQPQALDDETLGGIALTLGQMARLGLNIAFVVDCDDDIAADTLELKTDWEETVREQSARIVAALEEFNEPGAFEVDHALSYSDVSTEIPSTVQVRGGVEVKNSHLLFPPIEDGIIPVVPPWAYDAELRKVRVRPDDVVLALAREFAGFATHDTKDDEVQDLNNAPEETRASTILDRIIILDPLGGIPSMRRADGAHIFVNLEAEYKDVRSDLQELTSTSIKEKTKTPSLADSNASETPGSSGSKTRRFPGVLEPSRHLKNLDVVQRALKVLPPASSALIITPAEAAISSQAALLPFASTGVRTRRSKNPLIHNLLTDKPMISSSLPAPVVDRHIETTTSAPATFLKKGIPVTMIPDPRLTGGWQPPSPSNTSIELENDPRIDFPKLVDLIEDSFRRKLDARHYLDRIKGRVAGIIIAGNYEGGAICTWETPPSLTAPPPADSPMWIPYLDKFAVLTSSQGSGGVADIVWGALTRSCFPDGLVWRSRTSNPVNKWYFERAVGMWNLPDGQWTMFWTADGVVDEWAQKHSERKSHIKYISEEEDMTRWDAYLSVCGGVVPSWADGKRPD